jgi:hypothetical protein
MPYKQFVYEENAIKSGTKDYSQVEVMCEIPPNGLITNSGHTFGHIRFRPRLIACKKLISVFVHDQQQV